MRSDTESSALNAQPSSAVKPLSRWCRFCNTNHVATRAQFRRHIKQCQEVYWNKHRAKHGRVLARNHDLRNPGKAYGKDMSVERKALRSEAQSPTLEARPC